MKLDIPKELIESIKRQIKEKIPFYEDVSDIEITSVSISFEIKLPCIMDAQVTEAKPCQ